MKNKLKELGLTICVVYTLISVVGAILNIIGGTQTNNMNVIFMFFMVCVASSVLSLYKLFDRMSPLFMIVVQYLITIVLVMGGAFLLSFVDPVSPGGYRDLFVSFTIPYILIAAFFYIDLFRSTQKANDLLKDIQKK